MITLYTSNPLRITKSPWIHLFPLISPIIRRLEQQITHLSPTLSTKTIPFHAWSICFHRGSRQFLSPPVLFINKAACAAPRESHSLSLSRRVTSSKSIVAMRAECTTPSFLFLARVNDASGSFWFELAIHRIVDEAASRPHRFEPVNRLPWVPVKSASISASAIIEWPTGRRSGSLLLSPTSSIETPISPSRPCTPFVSIFVCVHIRVCSSSSSSSSSNACTRVVREF